MHGHAMQCCHLQSPRLKANEDFWAACVLAQGADKVSANSIMFSLLSPAFRRAVLMGSCMLATHKAIVCSCAC